MMNTKKLMICSLTALLSVSLTACRTASQEVAVTTAPTTQPATETKETLPASQFWEDVVELVNMAGNTTTAYKLEDGRYLDRLDRFFTYDGTENWVCDDGSIWNRKPDAAPAATNVYGEFAIERFLAQRPDHLFFSEAGGRENACKVVLTFDTHITNFRFLALEGQIDSTGAFVCSGMEQLYSRDEITENDLMVVETVLEGHVPNRGISFVDAGGNTRYYTITISGEDNVPLLTPFGNG